VTSTIEKDDQLDRVFHPLSISGELIAKLSFSFYYRRIGNLSPQRGRQTDDSLTASPVGHSDALRSFFTSCHLRSASLRKSPVTWQSIFTTGWPSFFPCGEHARAERKSGSIRSFTLGCHHIPITDEEQQHSCGMLAMAS
jgi:hypothetical protein